MTHLPTAREKQAPLRIWQISGSRQKKQNPNHRRSNNLQFPLFSQGQGVGSWDQLKADI